MAQQLLPHPAAQNHDSLKLDKLPSTTPNTNSTFTLFPNLPLEIQQKIWRHTFPHSRIVELINTQPDKERMIQGPIYRSRCEVPVAFWVCRTSRAEASMAYSPLSASMYHCSWRAATFVNFERDTIFISRATFAAISLEAIHRFAVSLIQSNQDLAKFRSLAFDVCIWGISLHEPALSSILSRFSGLQELIIVSDALKSGGLVGLAGPIVFLDDAEEEMSSRRKIKISRWKSPELLGLIPKLVFKGKRRAVDAS